MPHSPAVVAIRSKFKHLFDLAKCGVQLHSIRCERSNPYTSVESIGFSEDIKFDLDIRIGQSACLLGLQPCDPLTRLASSGMTSINMR